MTIGTDLYTKLTGTAGVAALVGTRVYPMRLPPGAAMPAITYSRVSGAREQALAGASFLPHPVFEISCWATTYAGADALAAAVRTAIDGWIPTGGAGTDWRNEIDLVDPETGWYRIALHVEIWHQ
jgi:hypothetical protein